MPGDILVVLSGRGDSAQGSPTAKNYPASSDSLVAQMVKRLPAMRETRVRFLGREDPLEKEMASTPALLPGKSHRWRSLVGYGSMGWQRVGHD